MGLLAYDILEDSSIDLKGLCIVQGSIGFCLAFPVCVFDLPVPFYGGVRGRGQWGKWHSAGWKTLYWARRRVMPVQRHDARVRYFGGQRCGYGGSRWVMWVKSEWLYAVWDDEEERDKGFETQTCDCE